MRLVPHPPHSFENFSWIDKYRLVINTRDNLPSNYGKILPKSHAITAITVILQVNSSVTIVLIAQSNIITRNIISTKKFETLKKLTIIKNYGNLQSNYRKYYQNYRWYFIS